MQTLTEENYLKCIYQLSNGMALNEKISTNIIAEKIGVNPASVTDMLKKLSERGYINYEKSRGVTLTEEGRKISLRVVRKHRLWEVFLVDTLKFAWDEVHDIAEELEHIKSEELIDRLDAFLEYPTTDPHGDPIPNKAGKLYKQKYIPLNEGKLLEIYTVTGVGDSSTSFLKFLDKSGIKLGSRLTITEEEEYDSSITIKMENGNNLHLSQNISKKILVQ